MKIGIYPGNFDPVTNGHMDIILRSLNFVDRLIVAVYENEKGFYAKRPMIPANERCENIKCSLRGVDNVEVRTYSVLLTDFAKDCGAGVIVKGLRNTVDFEYEKQMAEANFHLSGIDTVFIMSRTKNAHISSSLVKEIYAHGGRIDGMVPAAVMEYFAAGK